MSWFKQTTSGASIGLGVFFMLAGIHSLNDKTLSPEDRTSDSLACLLISVPLTGWGALTQRNLRLQKQQAERDRLRSVLFGLLKQSDTVTTLQFAMAADISGEAAKQFLDEQARLFTGDYDVDDRGEIFYRFRSRLPLDPPSVLQSSLAGTFDVILFSCPIERKVAIAKAVRDLTGMSLKKAKNLVGSSPRPVVQNIQRDLAEAYIQRLERAGAIVMLDSHQGKMN